MSLFSVIKFSQCKNGGLKLSVKCDDSLFAPLVTLQLHQQCEDRSVLRYVYYYLARILSDNSAQGMSGGGGIPTPNWDALADIDAVGGVTRADVVPRIAEQLTSEASNDGPEGRG